MDIWMGLRPSAACRRSLVSRAWAKGSASDRAGEWQVRRNMIGDTDADAPSGPRPSCLPHRRARSSTEREGAPQARLQLQKAGVQPLQLAFGHRVEVDTTNALLGTSALQPTQENLSIT